MNPHFDTEHVTVWHGDCIDVMRTLPPNSVDAVVCDPPYAINFMGKKWDNFTEAELKTGEMLGQQSQNWNESETHSRGYADNNTHAFQAWCRLWATEAYRLLKPGGHLLAFGGTRTFHRLAAGIEDAGFEIRDSIAWLYGSGFPKSLDVSKAIDKQRDDRTEVLRVQKFLEAIRVDRGLPVKAINQHFGFAQNGGGPASKWTANTATPAVPSDEQWAELGEWLGFRDETMTALVARLNARKGEGSDEWNTRPSADYSTGVGMGQSWRNGEGWTGASARGGDPVRDAAKQWQGWGTALKPAFEPIVVARKPLSSTVAANVLAYGTGALNIDASRIGTDGGRTVHTRSAGTNRDRWEGNEPTGEVTLNGGRWPANVVLDASQAAALDQQSGVTRDGVAGGNRGFQRGGYVGGTAPDSGLPAVGYGGEGGASRFFKTVDDVTTRFMYTAKAGSGERPKVEREGGGNGRVTGLGGKVRQCNVCGTRAIESGAGSPSCGHEDFFWADPTTSTTDTVSHPTVKPLDLMRWLVKLVTPKGGTVLEPFAGSGTTVEAAVLEGFRCIAIEREADYLPLIMQRVSKPHAVGLDFGDWEDAS